MQVPSTTESATETIRPRLVGGSVKRLGVIAHSFWTQVLKVVNPFCGDVSGGEIRIRMSFSAYGSSYR